MEYTQNFQLDLNTNRAYTVVSAKQGDSNSRVFIITLTQDGAPYTVAELSDTHKVYFRMRKPDGHVAANNVSVVDGKIKVILSDQCLAVAGRAYADIYEYDTNGEEDQSEWTTISTVSFIINIMSAPDLVSVIKSKDEFLRLEEVVEKADEVLYASEAWAVGNRNGSPVTADILEIQDITGSFNVTVQTGVFKTKVDQEVSTTESYIFTYLNDKWNLNNNEISLYQYGISLDMTPSENDSFTISYTNNDEVSNNNSKYWAEKARQYTESINTITADAEAIDANLSPSAAAVYNDNTVNIHFKLPKGKGIDEVSFEEDGTLSITPTDKDPVTFTGIKTALDKINEFNATEAEENELQRQANEIKRQNNEITSASITVDVTKTEPSVEKNGHNLAFTLPNIKGETGNGINSISLGEDYKLTFGYTDGASQKIDKSIQGPQGNGISSIKLNDDYTLTIKYTDSDKEDYTTIPIRGAIGNGISSISLGEDYKLTINYTDGTKVVTDPIRGETGNGISSIKLNDDYTLTINYTDGNSTTTGSIRGQQGEPGPYTDIEVVDTITGEAGTKAKVEGDTTEEGKLKLTFTIPKGKDGDGAGDMLISDYDKTGAVKTAGGIASYVNENGGKIDTIKFNSVEQVITNKVVNLVESDPTVPDWAKAKTKPSYTYDEVGAAPEEHNHDNRYYTESEIDTKLNDKLDTSLKGANNGLATLDSSGKVPSDQLPSYVDDVLEYSSYPTGFPTTGEGGIIYIDTSTNKSYRWTGTQYILISSGENGIIIQADEPTDAEDGDIWIDTDDEIGGYQISVDWDDINNKPDIPDEVTEETISNWGFTKNTGTYIKPTDGIPKTDLDSGVQTSLNKADTALQAHQDISGKQDVISDLETIRNNASDAESKAHTHSNKAILDATTAAFTTEQATAISTNTTNIATNTTAISELNADIGDTTLPTTAQTLTGAIAELHTNLTAVTVTVDKDGTIASSISAQKVVKIPILKLCVFQINVSIGTFSQWKAFVTGMPVPASGYYFNFSANTTAPARNGNTYQINASGSIVFANAIQGGTNPTSGDTVVLSGAYIYKD